MTQARLLIAAVSVAALIASTAASCSGGRSTGTDTASETDSTLTDTVASGQTDVLPPMLPDTAYSSVSYLDYKVERADTTTDGIINCTANMYASTPGVFTFRGGAYRDADFHGTVSGTPSEITVDWEFHTAQARASENFGSWGGGSGWTGQPLYVEWPDSCIRRFRSAGTLTPDFSAHEIIVGSLAGKIYFIDFNTGKSSRQPIDVTNPIKGTISLDPTLNGNLYVGQGIPVERPFGALTIDLYRHQVTHTVGEDPKAPRRWGAYDSSPLRVGQFLLRPGENGTLYKYLITPGSLKLHSALRYTTPTGAPGMEASMSAYANYGYTADNHGNLICTNLNTMRPVWVYRMDDDTDSSPVLIVEDGHPYIYTGSEIDRQQDGYAKYVKIDGLDGHAVWESKLEGRRADVNGKHFDGGFYATSLPGSGDCSHLIFINMVRNLHGQNGEFIALERTTGRVVYATLLKYYAWSSPVGFLNEQGQMFILTADCTGNVYLIRGSDGTILHSRHVGNNFESSPVAIGNSVVVGSRGNTIYRLSIK
ncbi:MAG: dehydrogenase [Muribaculaceae bacterium]|nr:dehydrogenase [Muribaculaceae bacterium]